MALRYQITNNNLQPNTFVARTIQGQRIGLDALIERIVTRTSLSTADMRAAVTALTEEVHTVLARGDTAVVDGLATFHVSLSGSFTSPETTISRDTAQLHLSVHGDSRLQAAIAAATTYERVVRDIKVPIITSFYDVSSAAFDLYTSGSIVRLQGTNMKFDQSRLDEGIFLRNDGDEVRVSVYSGAGARHVDALVPTALSGTIQVVLRTRYTLNGTLREGRFQHIVHQAG